MGATPCILVVEDKPSEREAMARLLRLSDYEVNTAQDAEQALSYLDDAIDLVITDLRMGDNSGLDLMKYWKERKPNTPFVMVTAFGDVSSAVEAMKLGAEDYLGKPVNPDELLVLVRKVIDARNKDARIRHLEERLDERLGFENIIGASKPMLEIFDQARRAAQADSTVLITGESGVGKELIAEAIHQNSPRKDGPFVAVNIAAVPETLVESELFGHVKGAYTGATSERIGRFEAGHNGTLFIDEIGDMELTSQAKLLRVLENHRITPVGGNKDKELNVRVVAATSRDLERMVMEGDFREDLYYRLNVVAVHIPALRDRREDIPLLVGHFLDDLCEANNKPRVKPSPDLMRFLESYEWPGNVRQLRNCLESMVVLAQSDTLTTDDLPATVSSESKLRTDNEHVHVPAGGAKLRDVEKKTVLQVLEQCGGNRTRAAEVLDISVRTLQRKLKRWEEEGEEVPAGQ